MSGLATLLPALDAFLEAAGRVQRRRSRERLEARLRRRMAALFERQGRLFAARLRRVWVDVREVADPPAPPAQPDPEPPADWLAVWLLVEQETRPALGAALAETARAGLAAGYRDTAAALRGSGPAARIIPAFDLANPRAAAYLADHGAALVTGIGETTRAELRTLLTEAMRQGRSYSEVAALIRERFAGFAGRKPQAHIRDRATLVAVTEAGEAYCEGQLMAARELAALGLALQKRWVTVGDARVTEGCRANAAAGWIDLEAAFPSGHLRPLRFPGCRCDMQDRVAPD